ncbi:unnamed protein product [Haemonchus placei]|uniref:Nucleotide-diphospho-sugar transferase domain-containing protein n=1 Tax=Haemonchus placei TaxID=6290 RepID=A0A158QLX6_HAEPC|nr:unnamed protein product [Haemonchus placei]
MMAQQGVKKTKQLLIVTTVLFVICTFAFYFTFSEQPRNVPINETPPEPQCQCNFAGTIYDFCYHLPPKPRVVGKRFDCANAVHLENLGLLSAEYALNLKKDAFPEPVFVTAMSDNHFREGLTLEKCLLEIRVFPFDIFPSYVKDLYQFRWKPLIIAKSSQQSSRVDVGKVPLDERKVRVTNRLQRDDSDLREFMTLKEFGAVWYMDTSIRWKKDRLDLVHDEIRSRNFLKNPNVTTCGKSAYLLQLSSSHGVFPTTNPGVYEYIPTILRYLKQRSSENHDAGFAFVVRTKDAIKILKWYVLCALEKDCMAPPGAQLYCNFGEDRWDHYAGCHRYDQSVINLLLANAYGYNAKNYVSCLGFEGAIVNRSASNSLKAEDFLCDSR